MTQRLLFADDEEQIRKLIVKACRDLGWEFDEAKDGTEALDLMQRRPHDVYLFDIWMPGLSGLDLARRVIECEEAPAVLIMTGQPEIDTAVDAMKHGVLDYIQKPIDFEKMKSLLIQAAKYHENYLRNLRAAEEREKTVKNIEEANERFCTMLQLSHDAIFLLDVHTGKILDCNATAYERLGCTRHELLRGTLLDVVNLSPATDWNLLVSCVRDEQSFVSEGIECHKEGEGLPVEISLSLSCLASGEYIAAVARDIGERKRTERALDEARRKAVAEAAKLRATIDGMEQGVVLADETGKITDANDGFLDMVRMPREMILGGSIWNILGEEFGSRRLRPLIDDLRRGIDREKEVVNQDFMDKSVSVRIQPIFHDDNYRGVILNAIEVGNLVEARKKAEDGSRFKSEYLARMAFEMRTHLDGIMGMIGLLLDTKLKEDQRILLQTAEDCVISLNNLLTDIRDISKIEKRELDMEPSDFDLQTVVEEAAAKARREDETNAVELFHNFEDNLPMLLRGHADHLTHAIMILLEDALKLFAKKRILLALSGEKREDDRVRIVVVVSESGDESSHEAGVAEDRSVEKSVYPGADISASLLRSLVEMQNGTTWANTVDGEVCSLCFDIIAEIPSAGLGIHSEIQDSQHRTRGEVCRVLIVEDSRVSRMVMQKCVQNAGADVKAVTNGQEALDILEKEPFDIVLMDVEMPEMDGLEATRRIRKNLKLKDIYVIAITAHAMKDDREICLGAGMNDFLPKPVRPETVEQAIQRWSMRKESKS